MSLQEVQSKFREGWWSLYRTVSSLTERGLVLSGGMPHKSCAAVKKPLLPLLVISQGSCGSIMFCTALPLLSASVHNSRPPFLLIPVPTTRTYTAVLQVIQCICCSYTILVISIPIIWLNPSNNPWLWIYRFESSTDIELCVWIEKCCMNQVIAGFMWVDTLILYRYLQSGCISDIHSLIWYIDLFPDLCHTTSIFDHLQYSNTEVKLRPGKSVWHQVDRA